MQDGTTSLKPDTTVNTELTLTGTGTVSTVVMIDDIEAPVFDLIRPTVRKTTGDGTHLNFDAAMYEDDYLLVIVNYTGMAPGQAF